MIKKFAAVFAAVLLQAFSAPAAEYSFERIGRAPADETYFGLNDPRNNYKPYEPDVDMHPIADTATGESGRKKYNAAYAWGVTEVGDEIWFGTLNTGWCGWMSTHLRLPLAQAAFNFESARQVCGLLEGKAPQLFIYNVNSGTLRAINPDGQVFDGLEIGRQVAPDGEEYSALYGESKGINVRAAGNHDGIVFFGALDNNGSSDCADLNNPGRRDYITLIAFDVKNKRFMGSRRFPYDTVRRLNVIEHPDGSSALYAFMGPDTSTQQCGVARSVLLRWVGTPESPFTGGVNNDGFDVVGEFDIDEGAGGEFVLYEKGGSRRIVVSTWAGTAQSIYANCPEGADCSGMEPKAGGLFVTTPMPPGGFTAADRAGFIKIFSNDEFEPDPLAAKGYEMGAMTMWGDYLYWGTMHVGASAGYKHYVEAYPEINEYVITGTDAMGLPKVADNPYQDTEFADEALKNSWRAAMLFRTDFSAADELEDLKELGNAPYTELLYGEKSMTVYDDPGRDRSGKWVVRNNLKNMEPKFGPMGLGNLLNVYMWTMKVHNGRLYLGTFDLSGGIRDYLLSAWDRHKAEAGWTKDAVMKKIYDWASSADGRNENFIPGADLFVMEDHESPAKIITLDGFGNGGNNGVRNSAVIDGRLIFGTSTYSALDDGDSGASGGYEYFEVRDSGGNSGPGGEGSSSGGCSAGGGSDAGLAALLLGCAAVFCVRRFTFGGGKKRI